MLQNLPKCSSYILIDTEYLISKINEGYRFYKDLYPDREFEQFDILNMINIVASTTKITVPNETTNIVFLYKLGNSSFPNAKGFQDVLRFADFRNTVSLSNDEGSTINFYSFFADPFGDEFSYNCEYNDLLREIVSKKDVFTIIMCKDGHEQNDLLEKFNSTIDKSFYIFRDIDPEIGLSDYSEKFRYVTIDYVIALCMGLKQREW